MPKILDQASSSTRRAHSADLAVSWLTPTMIRDTSNPEMLQIKNFFLGSAIILFAGSTLAETSLLDKRRGHVTAIIKSTKDEKLPSKPPTDFLKLIKYQAGNLELSAYLSTTPGLSEPGPAIIWLTGGFPVASPGTFLWEETSSSNEQSARIYRLKGIRMMYPILRGRSGNPGEVEGFYGEVNDVIHAFEFLSKQEGIDPKRIYLGGHSTGGTLALLVAASTDKFAGVFSFGPVDAHYGEERAVYKWNQKERDLRSPALHLASIKTPTLVVEGEHGNFDSLMKLNKANKNPLIRLQIVNSANHFNTLHPLNTHIAEAILGSKDGSVKLTRNTVGMSYLNYQSQQREAEDLETLAKARRRGIKLEQTRKLTFYLYSDKTQSAETLTSFVKKGFAFESSKIVTGEGGKSYAINRLTRNLIPTNLEKLWQFSSEADALSRELDLEYGGWDIE